MNFEELRVGQRIQVKCEHSIYHNCYFTISKVSNYAINLYLNGDPSLEICWCNAGTYVSDQFLLIKDINTEKKKYPLTKFKDVKVGDTVYFECPSYPSLTGKYATVSYLDDCSVGIIFDHDGSKYSWVKENFDTGIIRTVPSNKKSIVPLIMFALGSGLAAKSLQQSNYTQNKVTVKVNHDKN